jgi:predicted TIM-barrel fold metal-dependent hydrolase
VTATKIFDIHANVISPDTGRHPLTPMEGVTATWFNTRPISCEQMIAAMDASGIDKTALVHVAICYGHDNSYAAACIAKYPDRFTGIYSVDVLALDAVERIEYWRERGMSGLRLFTGGSKIATTPDWLTDPRSFPAWEHAEKIGLPICLQTTPVGFPHVRDLLERFPRVKVILDHVARPDLRDGPPYTAAASLFDLACFPNLYLKITSRTFGLATSGKATPETFFPRLVEQFGANRLAYGSNYPGSEGALPEMVARAFECTKSLSENDREWLFRKTAQSLHPDE